MLKLLSGNHDAVCFGAILRRLRIARGWTILVAAQRNMPSVDTLLGIAYVYGVNASDIVREVEEARSAARRERVAERAAEIKRRMTAYRAGEMKTVSCGRTFAPIFIEPIDETGQTLKSV